MDSNKPILVTGAAGFIGFHLTKRLLEMGKQVIGLDNLNPYYDVQLKRARLALLEKKSLFRFFRIDISNQEEINHFFQEYSFDLVFHMAAQAGVRYSTTHPHAYSKSNLVGFLNILEGCRHQKVQHLVFASSSSVYGASTQMPFSIHDPANHPVSLYAATKKSNELMAYSYASLYGLPCTGIRFFTVYGPWGRPDMALFLFTQAMLDGRSIELFNHGEMYRDFTYIDDAIEGTLRLGSKIPEPNPDWSSKQPDPATGPVPYRIYNIGGHRPISISRILSLLEETLGRKTKKIHLPIQPGDVLETYADISDLERETGFHPVTLIEEGIPRFVRWYLEYHKVQI